MDNRLEATEVENTFENSVDKLYNSFDQLKEKYIQKDQIQECLEKQDKNRVIKRMVDLAKADKSFFKRIFNSVDEKVINRINREGIDLEKLCKKIFNILKNNPQLFKQVTKKLNLNNIIWEDDEIFTQNIRKRLTQSQVYTDDDLEKIRIQIVENYKNVSDNFFDELNEILNNVKTHFKDSIDSLHKHKTNNLQYVSNIIDIKTKLLNNRLRGIQEYVNKKKKEVYDIKDEGDIIVRLQGLNSIEKFNNVKEIKNSLIKKISLIQKELNSLYSHIGINYNGIEFKEKMEDCINDFLSQIVFIKKREIFTRISKITYYIRKPNSQYMFEYWEDFVNEEIQEFNKVKNFEKKEFTSVDNNIDDVIWFEGMERYMNLLFTIDLNEGIKQNTQFIQKLCKYVEKDLECKGDNLEQQSFKLLSFIQENEKLRKKEVLKIFVNRLNYKAIEKIDKSFDVLINGDNSQKTIAELQSMEANLLKDVDLSLMNKLIDSVENIYGFDIDSSGNFKFEDIKKIDYSNIDHGEKDFFIKMFKVFDNFEDTVDTNISDFVKVLYMHFLFLYCIKILLKKKNKEKMLDKQYDEKDGIIKLKETKIKGLELFLQKVLEKIKQTDYYQKILDNDSQSIEKEYIQKVFNDIQTYVQEDEKVYNVNGIYNFMMNYEKGADNIDFLQKIVDNLSGSVPGTVYYYFYKNIYDKHKDEIGGFFNGEILINKLDKIDSTYSPGHNYRTGKNIDFLTNLFYQNNQKLRKQDKNKIKDMKKDFQNILQSNYIQKQLKIHERLGGQKFDFLKDKSEKDMDWLKLNRFCASFHDLPKLDKVNPLILSKHDNLTETEYAKIKGHINSVEILSDLFPNQEGDKYKDKFTYYINNYIKNHHRDFDGGGYGMVNVEKENICIESRIGHIADIVDAIMAPRAYENELNSLEREIDYLKGVFEQNYKKNKQALDPVLVGILLDNRNDFKEFVKEQYSQFYNT